MVLQGGVQLAVSDIDGKDHGRAVRQQNLGEASCGRADVEADMALDLDGILFQRGCELDAAAGDVGMRRLGPERGIARDDFRRLYDGLVIGDDEARVDCRARPCPALEQPALDQEYIDAFAGTTPVELMVVIGRTRAVLEHDPEICSIKEVRACCDSL